MSVEKEESQRGKGALPWRETEGRQKEEDSNRPRHAEDQRSSTNNEKEKRMRNVQQFANRITNWEMFIVNLRPFLPEMPFLQAILTEMETVLTEARGLDSEQEVARGRL